MNNKLKLRATKLFEEGWDTQSVTNELDVDQSVAEQWYREYTIEQGLEGLSDNPEQVEELLESIQEFNALKREELDLYEKEKAEAELKEKRSRVIHFKKLFAFLKNHCQGFKWNYNEVILLIKKLKTLQEQVESISLHDQEYFEKLFIWNRIVGLVEHLEQLAIDKEDGDIIKFEFDDNDVLYLEEALEISSFEDEIEEVTEEEQTLDGLLEEEFSPQRC